MRALALLLSSIPLLAACTQEVADGDAPSADALPAAAWSGSVGEGACVGGTLTIFLDDIGPALSGTAYYESVAVDGNQYRSTYRLEGEVGEGALHLDEADLVEADQLPPDYRWCTGSYDFALDPTTGKPELAGSYASDMCGCTHATTMRPIELY